MPDNRAIVYHNLSVMLEAGVPVLRSLNTVLPAAKGAFGRAFSDVVNSVHNGVDIDQAMSRYPKIFDSLELALIHAGQLSGDLDIVLDHLSQWHEFLARIRRIILSGLALPLLLIHVAAFLGPIPAVFLGGLGLGGYIMQTFIRWVESFQVGIQTMMESMQIGISFLKFQMMYWI